MTDWQEIRSMAGHIAWVQGPCEHDRWVPVEGVTGEVVAGLCLDCDVQLPAGWR